MNWENGFQFEEQSIPELSNSQIHKDVSIDGKKWNAWKVISRSTGMPFIYTFFFFATSEDKTLHERIHNDSD